MQLNLFTPLPPCISFINNTDMMGFCGKTIMTDEECMRCKVFFDEMALDGRINSLRETEYFKNRVPEEKSHTICLWLKNKYCGYYSPGKIDIDDTYLLANGAEQLLDKFRRSFNREGRKPFEYEYSRKNDSKKFGDFLLLIRRTLEIQGYKPAQKINLDVNVINIVMDD